MIQEIWAVVHAAYKAGKPRKPVSFFTAAPENSSMNFTIPVGRVVIWTSILVPRGGSSGMPELCPCSTRMADETR